MEGQEQSSQEQASQENEKMKSWLQENMRIILSIIIVVAIAGGVYSYSKRNAENNSTNKNVSITQSEDEGIVSDEDMAIDETATSEEVTATEIESAPTENEIMQQEDRTSSTATSQETDESFIETAGAGDGLTHLARRALANYLEKNPDSTLTPEHKIYIEDYLRKNVSANNGMKIGTSVEFSKNLIQDAIRKSKELTEKQLQNLHQYSVRVPALS